LKKRFLTLMGFGAPAIASQTEFNMTQGVTQISQQVYELHMLIFYICCAIALIVFGAMFYAIFKHRKSKGAVAAQDTSQSDLTVKITGSQWKWHYSYFGEDVEFFSLLATSQKQIDGLEVKGANYLLEVDNPLVVPINRKIRFLLTSDDVIHSWWVPDFAVKKDTIPGFINEAWTRIDKPGVYRGQCAELCGRAHGFMPVVVHAMEENDFEQWLASGH